MSGALNWQIDGIDWPNRAASRFVPASGFRWHVQVMGDGPVLLLVHGTGASTHSWRRVMPLLAQHFTVVAPDMPGHGFTEFPRDHVLTLPGMAAALSDLMTAMAMKPEVVVGHSAGAAVLIRATLDGRLAPNLIVSLNGALLPFRGFAGQVFKPLAKFLVLQPFVPKLLSWRAGSRAAVESVLTGTGSRLAPRDIDLYARLFQSPPHVAATLAMMANWDLDPLNDEMPRLKTPLLLITGARDKAIPPSDAVQVRDRVAVAVLEALPDLGHLAHEEDPERIAELIMRHAARANTTLRHGAEFGTQP